MKALFIFAQLAAVSCAVVLGQVRDRTTGQALPDVVVRAGSHHATTDAGGRFRLGGVAVGSQTITVSSGDVPAQHFRIVVREPSTHADLRVCSTTLDYDCSGVINSSGGSG